LFRHDGHDHMTIRHFHAGSPGTVIQFLFTSAWFCRVYKKRPDPPLSAASYARFVAPQKGNEPTVLPSVRTGATRSDPISP
jgi:hypothetical protein